VRKSVSTKIRKKNKIKTFHQLKSFLDCKNRSKITIVARNMLCLKVDSTFLNITSSSFKAIRRSKNPITENEPTIDKKRLK
jgi:hypothetical protein